MRSPSAGRYPVFAPERLVTPRLVAERVEVRHLELMAALDRDERVMRFLGGVGTTDETKQRLKDKLIHWRAYGFGLYALFERPGGADVAADDPPADPAARGPFVGRVGLQFAAGDVQRQLGVRPQPQAADVRRRPREDGRAVELLYALAPEAWGRGYATEAGRALLDVAFAQLDLPSVIAFTVPLNLRSRAVVDRLGFEFVGDVFHSGQTHVLFRLDRPLQQTDR